MSSADSTPPWLTLVGIGEDGYPGLGKQARRALLQASRIVGAARQLELLPPCIGAARETWPTPFSLEPLLARRGQPTCVLASGDPMLFGVGASLARQLPATELRVLPAPSSLSLAAARLGWALQEVACLSLVARPLAALQAQVHDGRRLLVLSNDGDSPAAIARLLNARGFGASRLSVLEHLGGPLERRLDGLAGDWSLPRAADLNLVAVECRAGAGAVRLPLTPGLADEAYRHDGQLTKRDVRAVTLARLAPCPRRAALGRRRRLRLHRHRMDARAPQLPGDRHRSQRRAPGTYPPQPRRPRRTDPAPGRRQRPGGAA